MTTPFEPEHKDMSKIIINEIAAHNALKMKVKMDIEEVVKSKLELISDFQAQKDLLDLQKKELIDTILTPEIKEKVAEIEAEFVGKGMTADENINALTAEVKDMVRQIGSSIKSLSLHAIFIKGRITWDPKSLDGYAIAHPEILNFRREGEPSVSIRRI